MNQLEQPNQYEKEEGDIFSAATLKKGKKEFNGNPFYNQGLEENVRCRKLYSPKGPAHPWPIIASPVPLCQQCSSLAGPGLPSVDMRFLGEF